MEKIFVHFLIYVLGSPSSYMYLHPIPSEFPIYEENFILFFISAAYVALRLVRQTYATVDYITHTGTTNLAP